MESSCKVLYLSKIWFYAGQSYGGGGGRSGIRLPRLCEFLNPGVDRVNGENIATSCLLATVLVSVGATGLSFILPVHQECFTEYVLIITK